MDTLVETPGAGGEWALTVFSQDEYDVMQTMFTKVLHEFDNPEPIAVVFLFSPEEFAATLTTLAKADAEGYDLGIMGVTMAQEYLECEAVEGTDELNEASVHFWKPWLEDDEDEDSE